MSLTMIGSQNFAALSAGNPKGAEYKPHIDYKKATEDAWVERGNELELEGQGLKYFASKVREGENKKQIVKLGAEFTRSDNESLNYIIGSELNTIASTDKIATIPVFIKKENM